MIGLDTNLLVRYLPQDEPVESARATEIIEQQLTPQNRGFISVVAMAEIVRVLEHAYHLRDEEIAMAIERTLQARVLVVEHEHEVFVAMVALKERRNSFADALIGALGTSAGCTHTLTFDQEVARSTEFELA
jgi:predicted nucleic-acid-binding protein